ncbi:phage baseplate upper protein [Staphylococcus succinus]|uniref:phage baseplate upper protein n=1 Tax=Staphylococcus succinus TaxID=61015 RepID=UPI00069F0925|nr:phage baseplate upper protein [Staphylococcus succinus]MDH9162060.1 phage baseplate upper protein [Staphylococcus succinus]PNZ17388.1 phage baseplate upper protein [Staphylococcus succinus subsp. succinus]
MAMDKIAQTKLDVTAYYRDLKQLNVEFYNQDINTSTLKFQITRNNKPMLLSDINVNSQIILVTSDGSKKVDNLTFEDEMNGVLSYTLPNDVLVHVGDVTGEIFINRKGSDDTIVVRTFKFSIKDALVNTISADTKLSYIRKFDDLEALIKERAIEIQKSIEGLEDYVTKVTNARDDALQAIGVSKDEVELIIENGKSEIQGLLTNETFLRVTDFEQYKTNIDSQMTDFKDSLEEKTKGKVNEEDFVTQLNELKNELKLYTDSKKDATTIPLTLINGTTMISGGLGNKENITMTYYSIGNNLYQCQLNGWVQSPQTGDFTNIPEGFSILTDWNNGFDVPQRSSLMNTARIYIRPDNTVGLIRIDNVSLPYSLDSINFIAKGV